MAKSLITPEIEAYIRCNYLTCLGSDMARKFHLRPNLVQTWMRKNRLVTPKDVVDRLRASKLIGRTRVTPEQDEFIKANYLTMPQKQIAAALNISYCCFAGRLKNMGIVIPKEIIEKFKKQSQIKPGNVPINKGMKQSEYMAPEAIERTKATRFKKGQLPHNSYNEIGKITIRHEHPTRNNGKRYKYICLALAEWKPLHIYNWEKKHGKVPKGHCLWFIDEDTLNCEIENLELITRAENMRRNSGAIHLRDNMVASYLATKTKKLDKELKMEILNNYPELIELKRTQLLLNREIKNQHDKISN